MISPLTPPVRYQDASWFSDPAPSGNAILSVRTSDALKARGQYFLGADHKFANSVAGLTGSENKLDRAILHLDLVETKDGLPARVQTIGCRLNELGANCEYITRELFRVHAVEGHHL